MHHFPLPNADCPPPKLYISRPQVLPFLRLSTTCPPAEMSTSRNTMPIKNLAGAQICQIRRFRFNIHIIYKYMYFSTFFSIKKLSFTTFPQFGANRLVGAMAQANESKIFCQCRGEALIHHHRTDRRGNPCDCPF